MGQKYVYNPLTCEYDIIDEGAPGLPGPRGPIGATGVGVPSGGTTGQVLSKTSDDDHDTEWTNPGGSEVVDDTSPQLGGDLESNGHGLLIGDISIRSGLDMDGVVTGMLMLGRADNSTQTPGIGSVGDLYIGSNIGEDGSGDWLPAIYMQGLDVGFELAPGGSLAIQSVSGGTSYLDPSGLTGTRTLYLPDKDGTILVDRNPRVLSTASIATIEPDVDEYDQYIVTAQAAALGIDDPVGDAVAGGKILFTFRDNGTPRALTWDSSYRGIGVTLPATTVAGKWVYVGAVYNAADSKWDVIAVMEET